MADTVGKQRIRTDAKTDVQVQLVGADNTNVNAVANPNFVELSDGATAIGVTGNALDVNVAAWEPTTPIKVDIDTQSLTAVKVSKDANANAVNNPIWVELTNGSAALGTAANPIYVVPQDIGAGQTSILKWFNTSIAATSPNTAAEYAVTNLKTFTLHSISVSCAEAAHFDVILDPVTADTHVLTLYTSPGSTQATYTFATPVTLVGDGTKLVRVLRVNDSHQSAMLSVTFEGTEATT